MKKSTIKLCPMPNRSDLRAAIHEKVAEVVETLLVEELSAVLGTDRYERTDERRGYRHGSERRRITTEYGPMEMLVPRGRVCAPDGTTTEFRSKVLPRYARRTERVDEAILGCYLAGANSRRIKKALAPLLGEENLSKSAISRVVGRIRGMNSRAGHDAFIDGQLSLAKPAQPLAGTALQILLWNSSHRDPSRLS